MYAVHPRSLDLLLQTSSGLIAVANMIGYALAIPLTSTSDRLAAYLTRRNNGIREAEMRLGVMLPAMLIGPAGLVVYGLAAERNLHWVLYFVGVAMVDWSAYFYFTFTLAVSTASLPSASADSHAVCGGFANSKYLGDAHCHQRG